MQKLKWHYDKKGKEWYTGESVPWANDGYTIKKESRGAWDNRKYSLRNSTQIVGRFNYLGTAKTVANLIHFGK